MDAIDGSSNADLNFYYHGLALKRIDAALPRLTARDRERAAGVVSRVVFAKAAPESRADSVTENLRAIAPLYEMLNTPDPARAPFLVGAKRSASNRIEGLYGNRFYESQRKIHPEQNLLGICSGWAYARQVRLSIPEMMPLESFRLVRGPGWRALPPEFREPLRQGCLPVTGTTDLYDLAPGEVYDLATQRLTETNPLRAYIEKRAARMMSIKQADFLLLHFGSMLSSIEGRNTILVRPEAGCLRPVSAAIRDYAYVIENKGGGLGRGGFGDSVGENRGGIAGACDRAQAEAEERVLAHQLPGGAMHAATVYFSYRDQELAYLVRLVPSTVRASYTANHAFYSLAERETTRSILRNYGQSLAEMLFASPGRIIDESAHPENIMLWADGCSSFTDYGDQVPFSDSRSSRLVDGELLTPRESLQYVIGGGMSVPGFSAESDLGILYTAFRKACASRGIELRAGLRNREEIQNTIWEKVMALQVVRTRMEFGTSTRGLVDDIGRNVFQVGFDLPSGETSTGSARSSRWGPAPSWRVRKLGGYIEAYLKEELATVRAAMNPAPGLVLAANEERILRRAELKISANLGRLKYLMATPQEFEALTRHPKSLTRFLRCEYA